MPGGALRVLVGSAQVAEIADELLPLVQLAVRQGHDALRNVRNRGALRPTQLR
jgi:hypothetical protein